MEHETIKPESNPIGSHINNRKHALIMVLCCLIPVVALAILWIIGISESYLIYAVILLCPLLHILMMLGHRSS